MKTKFCLVLSLLVHQVLSAQGVFDDFNGSSISGQWNTYNTTFGNSSVSEGGGNVQLANGAGLITASPYANATVQGSFRFTGDNDDRFKIYLRSDGTTFDSHWNDLISGIQIQFSPSSNPSPNNPALQIIDATTLSLLGQASPQINMNTFYNFTITDSGSQIDVYFDGSASPVLSVATLLSNGNSIGFFSREQAGSGPTHISQLDFISITVPEPSTLGLMGLSVFGFLAMAKRKS